MRRASDLGIPFLSSIHGKTKTTLLHFMESTKNGPSRDFLDTLPLRSLVHMVGTKGLGREECIDRLLKKEDRGFSPVRPRDLIDE
jgi:hypothetical protein